MSFTDGRKYNIKHFNTARTLDYNGNVYGYEGFHGGEHQQWVIHHTTPNNAYTLQHAIEKDGKKLFLDSNTAGNVYLREANGGDYQKWEIVDGEREGTFKLINVATRRALDINSDHTIYTHTAHGGDTQLWHVFGARV